MQRRRAAWFVYALEAGYDLVQVFVAMLLAFECLHKHAQDSESVSVLARLLDGVIVFAIPMHKVNLMR